MSVQADLRFGRIAVTKSYLTEDVLTEILIHQAADALSTGGIAKPLYQVAYDGSWLDEDSVQQIRLAARLQEFLDGEKELADLVLKHGIAGKDIVEEILNQQRELFKQTNGSPPGIATMLADEASLDEKQLRALRTLEQRMRKGPDKPTVIKVVTGPAAMPPLPPGMTPSPTPQPGPGVGPRSTKSGRPKCPGCGAALPSIRELHCDACGALFCPKCRAVVKAEDVVCGSCNNSLRAVEEEPKSKKGLIAIIVAVVVLAGAGIALGPGGLYEKLVGPAIDYNKLLSEARERLAAADEDITAEKVEEAKASLADAEKRLGALAGHIPEDRVVELKNRVQQVSDGIALLEKRLAERATQEEAARRLREKMERSHALVAESIKAADPDEARRLLDEALQLLPENAAAWHRLGLLLDKEGKRAEAKKELAAAADRKQLGTLGLLLMGQWSLEEKDVKSTRKWLNAVFSVPPSLDGPDSPELAKQVADARMEARRRLVILELGEDNLADAINHFREMGNVSGIDPELILRIADVYVVREENARAVDLYKAHLDKHPDCKRRILLEWRMRRLRGDESQDKADLVIIVESPRIPYFLSRETDKEFFVKNLPDDTQEVGLPRDACEVKRGMKNPMAEAFDLLDKRIRGIPLAEVTRRVERLEEFVTETYKAGLPPACVKRLCEAEMADLAPRDPKNAKLAEFGAKLAKWTIPAPSVKPPPPEEIVGPGSEGGTPTVGPTASRSFDADKVWKDLFDVYKRAKDKFGDPSKATERQGLEAEALRTFQNALKDAKPTEELPAKRWAEKCQAWVKQVWPVFMGDPKPNEDRPFNPEADLVSHSAVELLRACLVFAAPPASGQTPQQAFESLLADLASMRKQFPGNVRFYVTMDNDQKVVAFDKPSGTLYARRDVTEARVAQFDAEIEKCVGGQVDDTVKFKEKQLAAISSKLPPEFPLDKFNYDNFTAVDNGEDILAAAHAALEKTLEKVRK